MADRSPTQIPRHVNLPQQIFFWSTDELIPFSVLFIVGMVTGMLLQGLLAGVALMVFLRRFRDSRPDGYLLHRLYAWGLLPVKGNAALNPLHRRILP